MTRGAASLAVRSREPEWMDGADLSEATMAAVLADLARANRWTLNARPTLGFLARATRGWERGRTLRLIDVGAGGGDMLRAVHRWATRRGLVPDLHGWDLDPRCAAAARAATDPALGIHYHVGDAADAPGPAPDVIVSALVTHHMDDAAIVPFLRWMESAARRGWLVNDLHRHALARDGFALLAWAMRWHPIVRHDGPLSVARAFRRADWDRLLAHAAITAARVRWRVPFRLTVERLR